MKVTEHRFRELSGEVREPMCHEDSEFDRFILFNQKSEFEYADVYALYKKEIACFWTVEEMDLSEDVECWDKSSSDEQHFIIHILAFFASLDQIVMENVSVNFGDEIVIPQVRSHFAIQNAIESIHGEAYSILIQTYVKNSQQQSKILRSVQEMPIIRKKAQWVTSWMDPETCSLAERLVAFTCVEGVQFSGAFCAIYWLKKQGRFRGLCFANSLIARDEGLHAEGSVMIYNHLKHRLPVAVVHDIFGQATTIEKEFIREALPVSLIGINAGTMSTYIEYISDFWLEKLGYPKLFNSKNPFEWMTMIGMEGKSNFFEGRVAEYSKAGSMTSEADRKFTTDAAF
ncbi:putative ribonucleotide reductase small subunit [Feldmannia species virus]|uniref:Ribonucleoside-diphosphate reductase small chain n=1 Tax=Feldmannia species virus TaxID=39420 RepID=B5LWI3_9PHYC|nr:putative ribonucleotide reductase small subunit [Feldmannia species virus]ACH46846.1 putative ribonucleotide reductase small subunit [Feldmannia species virus]